VFAETLPQNGSDSSRLSATGCVALSTSLAQKKAHAAHATVTPGPHSESSTDSIESSIPVRTFEKGAEHFYKYTSIYLTVPSSA